MPQTPPSVQPGTPQTPGPAAPQKLSLKESQRKFWQGAIKKARDRRERHKDLWSENLRRYAPAPADMLRQRGPYEANANVDFRQVEAKKPQLFFEVPDIRLTPREPLADPVEDALTIHQVVLNDLLGPEGVNAKRAVSLSILNCLATAGWGPTKIGFEVTIADVDEPETILDPATRQPTPTGKTIKVKLPVHERYFWEPFSPANLLVPADCDSNDFDKAPWIGREFSLPLEVARRRFTIPKDFQPSKSDRPEPLTNDEANREEDDTTEAVWGQEIYYYAHVYDPKEANPEKIRELIFLDSLDEPVVHRDLPYQTFDRGRLSPDSLRGFPIHVLTLRDVPDSPYVPADSSMTRPLVDELNVFRGQLLKQRDATIPVNLCRGSAFSAEQRDKLVRGEFSTFIFLEDDAFSASNPPVLPANKAVLPRESFSAQNVIEQDIERTLGIGPTQTGVLNARVGARSATEVRDARSNADARMAAEQTRVIEWFLAGVRKLDALVQRFADDQQIVVLVGPDGGARHRAWDKRTISGRFAYTIQPDSQLRIDSAQNRQSFLEFYNLTANDPYVVRSETSKKLVKLYGLDPAKAVTEPPPLQPPPPNVQFRVSGEDLNPLSPQFSIVLEIVKAAGYQIPDSVIQAAQLAAQAAMLREQAQGLQGNGDGRGAGTSSPQSALPSGGSPNFGQAPHGGTLAGTPPINKHSSDTTGAVQGVGNAPPQSQ